MAATAVIAAAAVAIGSASLLSGSSDADASDSTTQGSTAPVTRGTISARTQVSGALGYADNYSVIGSTPGALTWAPAVGQVIKEGEVLYRVDNQPTVLLQGTSPAYRELVSGASGPDVQQLNAALVRLGYLPSADLDPTSDDYTRATTAGVRALQKHLGVAETGRLSLGDVAFLPTSARITAVNVALGAPATGTVLTATSTKRVVTVDLDVNQQGQVAPGNRVSVTLPDGSTVPGKVASVGTVATQAPTSDGAGGAGGQGGATTVPMTIALTGKGSAKGLDQAPVQVSIVTDEAKDVLSVPVAALLALAGGGYAVEVIDRSGARRLVGVTTGLFDDQAGLVEVQGKELAVGQNVAVPSS